MIQSQTFRFPAALDIDAVDTVVEPRIEADWIEDAVKKLARDRKGSAGDRLVPVAITTRFTSGGETRSYAALYDIGYEVEGGGLFDDREIKLRGLSLLQRLEPGKAQESLDALWKSRFDKSSPETGRGTS